MKIIHDRPPMFALIDATFRIAGKPVIFAWGDRIYNPERVDISPELFAHERVHCDRQGGDVELWWQRYCADVRFRFDEVEWASVMEAGDVLARCNPGFPAWLLATGRKDDAATIACKYWFRLAVGAAK